MWKCQISKMVFALALTINLFNFFKNRLGIFYSSKLFKWKIEIRFIVETSYLMEDKFKNVRKYFWNKFCAALFETTIKLAPITSLCIFCFQCIVGGDLSFPSGFKPNLLKKEIVSWIISSFDLLENPFAGLGVPFSPISWNVIFFTNQGRVAGSFIYECNKLFLKYRKVFLTFSLFRIY